MLTHSQFLEKYSTSQPLVKRAADWYGGPGGHAMRRYLSADGDVTVDDDDVTVDVGDVM